MIKLLVMADNLFSVVINIIKIFLESAILVVIFSLVHLWSPLSEI